jgi:hypothetical protein
LHFAIAAAEAGTFAGLVAAVLDELALVAVEPLVVGVLPELLLELPQPASSVAQTSSAGTAEESLRIIGRPFA